MRLLLLALLGVAALAETQCEGYGKIKCTAKDFGQKDDCVWWGKECLPASVVPSQPCKNFVNRACRRQEGCVWIEHWENGEVTSTECRKGGCIDLRYHEEDCIKHDYCAFRTPNGVNEFFNFTKHFTSDEINELGNPDYGDYHKKVRNECVDISKYLGTHDYMKLNIVKFCRAQPNRSKCNAPRFLAWPDRLKWGLEPQLCVWNRKKGNRDGWCGVWRDREGDMERRYGVWSSALNITEALPSPNPQRIIVPTQRDQEIGKDLADAPDASQKYANWDEYNDMCLSMPKESRVMGGGCEERGCVVYMDDTGVTWDNIDHRNRDWESPLLDPIYCAPRRPPLQYGDEEFDYSIYGGDPDVESTTGNGRFEWWLSEKTYQLWGIGDLGCEHVSPKYCETFPGCSVKEDDACLELKDCNDDSCDTCYICRGNVKSASRRMEPVEQTLRPPGFRSVAEDYHNFRRLKDAKREAFDAGYIAGLRAAGVEIDEDDLDSYKSS